VLNATQTLLATLSAGILVLTGLAAWLRWVRPRIQKTRGEVVAIRDSILGRDPIVDTITGREIEPALPGIGVRMAANEHNLERLTDAVSQIAQSHARLENHEERIVQLEAGAVERVMTKAESAAAWRAIAAVAGEPDEAPEDN
jgi:hypothetical protein